MFNLSPDTTRLALQHDLAHAQADRLRNEAVDAFWRGANAVLQRRLNPGAARLARSTRRLQARLARHWSGRHTALEG